LDPQARDLYKKIRKGGGKPIQVEKQIETIPAKHNLPLQLSSFIGREKEQGEIRSLLTRQRLVTLTGTGGIGKTRLALHVGQNLLYQFPGGIWFIAFDSLSDSALVPQTVASIFGIQEGANHSLIEQLTDSLREKTALLIFDNCEHLLEACTQLIILLLQNCSNLILVTSRETLNMPGSGLFLFLPGRQMGISKLAE
jgi:hypothetical protein